MSIKTEGLSPSPATGTVAAQKTPQKSLCARFETILKETSGRPIAEQAKACEQIFLELAQPTLALLQKQTECIATLKGNNELLTGRINAVLAEHEILKGRYVSLNDETGKLREKFDSLDANNQTAAAAHDALLAKHATLTAECEALKQTSAEIEKKYADLRGVNEMLMEKSAALEKQWEDLAADFNNLQRENTSFKTDSEALLAKVDGLNTACDALQAEILSWKEQYQKLDGEYARMKGIVDQALKDQVRVVRTDVDRKSELLNTAVEALSFYDIFGFRKTYTLFKSLLVEGKLPDKYPE